jgi:hypothetical protein
MFVNLILFFELQIYFLIYQLKGSNEPKTLSYKTKQNKIEHKPDIIPNGLSFLAGMEAALSGISVFKFLKTLRKTTSRNN